MDWLDFTFWWMEWPLKITVTGILVVALFLFWNNVIAMVFRGAVLNRTTEGKYVPTDGMGNGKWDRLKIAMSGQFGQGGRLANLFKWYGWFWFRSKR